MPLCAGCNKNFGVTAKKAQCDNCKKIFYDKCMQRILTSCNRTNCNLCYCTSCWLDLQTCKRCEARVLKWIIRTQKDIESRLENLEALKMKELAELEASKNS